MGRMSSKPVRNQKEPTTLSMVDAVDAYLTRKDQRVAIDDLSPETIRQYRSILENIWLPWCEREHITVPSEANDDLMFRFTESLKHRQHRGKSPSNATIRTYLRSVRLFLNWAQVDKGEFKPPKKLMVQRETVTREEIDAMERAATDERDRLVIRVLADTGVRISELLGLRAEDLREDSHNRHYFIRVTGKGRKTRDVPVPSDLFRRLKSYAANGGPQDGEFIFMAKRRRPGADDLGRLQRSGANQLVRNVARLAKVRKRIYPHLFRHSYVTHMLKQGASPAAVQLAVGHESSELILEVYNQLRSADTYSQVIEALKKR